MLRIKETINSSIILIIPFTFIFFVLLFIWPAQLVIILNIICFIMSTIIIIYKLTGGDRGCLIYTSLIFSLVLFLITFFIELFKAIDIRSDNIEISTKVHNIYMYSKQPNTMPECSKKIKDEQLIDVMRICNDPDKGYLKYAIYTIIPNYYSIYSDELNFSNFLHGTFKKRTYTNECEIEYNKIVNQCPDLLVIK